MNNRHRRVERLKEQEETARQFSAEIAGLIIILYGVTVEESARQVQTMIKMNSISFETLESFNR